MPRGRLKAVDTNQLERQETMVSEIFRKRTGQAEMLKLEETTRLKFSCRPSGTQCGELAAELLEGQAAA